MEEIKEQEENKSVSVDELSVDDSNGPYSLRYARSIPLIVEEIKGEINHDADAQVEAKRVFKDVEQLQLFDAIVNRKLSNEAGDNVKS